MKATKNKKKQSKDKKAYKQELKQVSQMLKRLDEIQKRIDTDLWLTAYVPGMPLPSKEKDASPAKYDFPFEDLMPGEMTLSCWLKKFPENALEIKAARTILGCSLEDKKAIQETTLELIQLQKEGSVIASATLGLWFMNGEYLPKDAKAAEAFLTYAAGKGDPVSCYLLATYYLNEKDGSGEDWEAGITWLTRSYNSQCPSAVASYAEYVLKQEISVSDEEMEKLCALLAALAVAGSWKCLKVFLDLLQSDLEIPNQDNYQLVMVNELKYMAEKKLLPAQLYLADIYENGVLFKANYPQAIACWMAAWHNGASIKDGLHFAQLLFDSPEYFSDEEYSGYRKEAIAILEECCQKKDCPGEAMGLLGSRLIFEDEEEEYSHGFELLNKSLDLGDQDFPVRSSYLVIMEEKKDMKKLKLALDLLDRLAEKQKPMALTIKAKFCFTGTPCTSPDYAQGMALLHEAASLGDNHAYSMLAEIYIFGLFGQEIDMDKARDWAMMGIKSPRESRCLIWAVLMHIGEFRYWNEDKSRINPGDLTTMFILAMSLHDEVSLIFTILCILNASTGLDRLKKGLRHPPIAADMVRTLGRYMAIATLSVMKTCHVGCVAFVAQSLGRVARTPYAARFAEAFCEEAELPSMSCLDLQKRALAFISSLPDSFTAHKIKYRSRDTQPLPNYEDLLLQAFMDLRPGR